MKKEGSFNKKIKQNNLIQWNLNLPKTLNSKTIVLVVYQVQEENRMAYHVLTLYKDMVFFQVQESVYKLFLMVIFTNKIHKQYKNKTFFTEKIYREKQ